MTPPSLESSPSLEPIRCARWPTLLLIVLVAVPGAARPAWSQVTLQDQRGIYVYTEHLPNDLDLLTGTANYPSALDQPGVDGLTILVGWGEIEPRYRSFIWDKLSSLLDLAVQHNIKKVDLAIRAGQDTPCWLFKTGACPGAFNGQYAGATELTFQVAAVQGVGQGCNAVPIAAPWDPVFLDEWTFMLGQVSAYLTSAPAYDQIVKSVRITGVNRSTAELRLPAEILSCTDNGVQYTANSVATWLTEMQREAGAPAGPCESTLTTAGTPSLNASLACAWTRIAGAFAENFPNKFFTLPIIPTASGSPKTPDYPFPPLDDDNCVYSPAAVPSADIPAGACVNAATTVPDQNFALLDPASALFAPNATFPEGRLIVAYQNLDLRDLTKPALRVGHEYVTRYALASAAKYGGVPLTGFQTNDYNPYNGSSFEMAACSGGTANPGPCTSSTYLQLLETGIFPCETGTNLCGKTPFRSQYIEVLPPDVIPNLGMYPQTTDVFGFPDAVDVAHGLLVDYTAPITTASESGPGRNGWFDGPVNVTFTATDDLSGVQSTQFSTDGGSTWTTGSTATITSEGVIGLVYRSIDNAGNVEANRSTTLQIDTTPPVTTATIRGMKRQSAYVGPVTISLAATDNLSGVARTEWSGDGGATWSTGTTIYVNPAGTFTFLYRSIDIAGNVEPAHLVTVQVTYFCTSRCQ